MKIINVKRKISSFLIIGVLLILMGILPGIPGRACAQTAEDLKNLSGNNWMSKIDDDRLLSEINIPGTHDAATKWIKNYGAPPDSIYDKYAQCQELYIDGEGHQLDVGIRYLDLRLSNECDGVSPKDDGSNLWLVHGNWLDWKIVNVNGRYFCKTRTGVHMNLRHVFQYLKDFLHAHPSETVIVCLSRETGTENEDPNKLNKTVYERIKTHLQELYDAKNDAAGNKRYLYTEGSFKTFSKMPTLGQCRGQIVVISDHPDMAGAGANYSDSTGYSTADSKKSNPVMNIAGSVFYYENHYDVKKDEKYNWVKDIYDKLGGEKLPTDPSARIGHGFLVQTSANVVNKQSPKEIAEYVNPRIYPSLFKKGYFYGWVLSDFVSADTAKAIWSTNFLDHTHTMEMKPGEAATCTKAGKKTSYYCSGCRKYFLDRGGMREIEESALVIPAPGHTESAPVRENVHEATEGSDGSYDELVYCSVCKEQLSKEHKKIEKKTTNAVEYIDEKKAKRYCNSYTLFGSIGERQGWALGDGWYVVKESRTCSSHRLTVSGDANLILCDGATLTLAYGIRLYRGSLTIWCQSGQGGKLICTDKVESANAGIGGNKGEAGGKLILHGGEVSAKGGKYAAGVGGGDAGTGGTVIVYGGTLKATGGDYGSGIGGGEDRGGGSLTVYGGTVIASAGDKAAGIGGGYAGSQGGDVIIYDGTVTATGKESGAGIGGGEYYRGGGMGGNVTIRGGIVTAIGAKHAAGIGGGKDGSQSGKVTISGGTVKAEGGSDASGIGGGRSDNGKGGLGGDVLISGGNVYAQGKGTGGGIGNGWRGGDANSGTHAVLVSDKVPFAGKFVMTGGTLLAGGGDRPGTKDYGHHGWSASFTECLAAAAIKTNTVNLAENLMVSAGDAKDKLSLANRVQRGCIEQRSRYVKIEACPHKNETFRITEDGHSRICSNCDSYFSGEEKHTFNAKYECTVCGYKIEGNKIEFAPGEGSGSMSYVVVPSGKKYTLPKCDFTAPQGKNFAGWSVPASSAGSDTKIYAAGQEIDVDKVINSDKVVKVTAVWGQPFDLWIGDKQVTYENCSNILGDGTVSYDPSTKILTLNNLQSIRGTHKGALIYAQQDLTILGKGTIAASTGSADIGIYAVSSPLTIGGQAETSISVTADKSAIFSCGVTLQSGHVKAFATKSGVSAAGIDCYNGGPVVISENASCEVKGISNSIRTDYSIQVNPKHCVQVIEDENGGAKKAGMISGSHVAYKENYRKYAVHVLITPHKKHTEQGSDLEVIAAKGATCTEDGTQAHYRCKVCGKLFTDNGTSLTERAEKELRIAATGHVFGEWKDTVEGKQRECRRCGYKEINPSEDYKCTFVEIVRVEPTCTEEGSIEHWCMVAEDGSIDGCFREMTDEEKTKSGITGEGEASYITNTDKTVEIAYVEVEENDWRWLIRIEPEETSIPAKGHVWGTAVYTWADGNTSVTAEHTCTSCSLKESVTASEEEGNLNIFIEEATCTEPGEKQIYAVFDHPDFTDQFKTVEIAATGHTEQGNVRENETEPTCEEAGSYDEVVYCQVCGEEISRETKTESALGHDYGEWIVLHDPTPDEDGLEVRICSNDTTHVEFRDIPMSEYDDYYCAEGDDSIWINSSEGGLSFVFSRQGYSSESLKDRFSRLIIDADAEIEVPNMGYELDTPENGLRITLKKEYLEDLDQDTFIITAEFDDGYADASFTVTSLLRKDGLIYNGSDQELVEISENGLFLFALGNEDEEPPADEYSDHLPTGVDAGTYYVWYKPAGSGDDEDISPECMSVDIIKADIDPVVTLENWSYGETAKAPAVTGNSGDGEVTYMYKKKDTDDLSYTSSVPKAAGEYVVKASVEETQNYMQGEAEASFEIKKAEASITPPVPKKLTYDGTSQVLADAGSAAGGTMYYARGESQESAPESGWSVSIPRGSSAGSYYVWYKAVGDKNHTDSTPSSVAAVIDKAELTEVILSQSVLKYNGNDQTVGIVEVKAGDLSVPSGCCSVTGNSGKEPGKYTVKIEASDEDGNINFKGSCSSEFEIISGDASVFEVNLSKTSFSYDGKAKTPSVTVKNGVAVLTEGKDYELSYIDNVDAGTGKVKVSGRGGYQGTRVLVFTIDKSDAMVNKAPKASSDTLTYNGEEQALVEAGSASGGTLVYALTETETLPHEFDGWEETVPSKENAGKYYVWYKVVGDKNHNDTQPVGISSPVSIQKAPIREVILSDTILVYKPGEQKVSVDAVLAGADSELEVPDGAYTVAGSDSNKPGLNTVTVTAKENSNYDGTVIAEYRIIAAKASDVFDVSFEKGPYVYNGNAQTPVVTVKYSGTETTLTSGTDYAVSYRNNVDAGTAKIIVTGKGNYYGTKECTFAISKAALKSVTLSAGTLPYNGLSQSVEVTSVKAGTDSSLVVPADAYTVGGKTAAVDAGEYTVVVTAKSGSNYKGTVQASYNISADTDPPVIKVTVDGKTVDLSNKQAEYTQAVNVSVEDNVRLKDVSVKTIDGIRESTGWDFENNFIKKVSFSLEKNGAQYVIDATDYSGKSTRAIIILNIQSPTSVTVPPSAAANLEYDGSLHDLVTPGSASGGTMMYGLGTDTQQPAAYSIAIPHAADAGDYYVWYYVKGTGESTAAADPEKVTVTIAKKRVTVKANDQTVKLNGVIDNGLNRVTAEGLAAGQKLTSVKLEAHSTESAGEYKDKGEEQYGIKPSDAVIMSGGKDTTSNYVITYMNGILTVLRDNVSIRAPRVRSGLTYSGEPQALVTAGSAEGGTLKYALGNDASAKPDDGDYDASIPAGTVPGTYYVWYKAVGDDNHNTTDAVGPLEAVIDGKAVTYTAESVYVRYDGNPHGIDIVVSDPQSGARIRYGRTMGAYTLSKSPTITNVDDSPLIVYYQITADNCKTQTGSAMVMIYEGIQDVPEAPAVSDVGTDHVTLTAKEGYEYSIDGENWQKNPTFAGLRSDTEYSFYQRRAADDNRAPSAESAPAKVRTLKEPEKETEQGETEPKETEKENEKESEKETERATEQYESETEPAPGPEEADPASEEPSPAQTEAANSILLNSRFLVTFKGTRAQVRWGAVPGADHYEVYAEYCGKKKCRLIKTVQGVTRITFRKLGGKKLNPAKTVKAYVIAYRGNTVIGRTLVGHAAGSRHNCTNVKKLKVTKRVLRLAAGRKVKLKVKAKKMSSVKKLLGKSHGAKLRFASTDSSVAVVSKKGAVTAVGPGTCDIWVYAQNGCGTRVTVTVS